MNTVILLILAEEGGETQFTGRVWGSQNKNIAQPTKTPSNQVEAIIQRALNETVLPMRKKGKVRRKILLFCTPSSGLHHYSPSSLPQGKKGTPHQK